MRQRIGLVAFIGVIIARYVARKLGAFKLELIFFDHVLLDQIATGLIDRVRYIGVKFVGSVVVRIAIVADARSAVVAIVAANVILVPAATAATGEFAAGHGHKRTVAAFNDFEIAHHKTMVKGYGAERPQAILGFLHELDSNLGDIHSLL